MTLTLYVFDSDANLRWNAIKSVITLCLDKIGPLKQINVRCAVNLPWYDKQLVNFAHKRNRFYNQWNASKLKTDRDKYVRGKS